MHLFLYFTIIMAILDLVLSKQIIREVREILQISKDIHIL